MCVAKGKKVIQQVSEVMRPPQLLQMKPVIIWLRGFAPIYPIKFTCGEEREGEGVSESKKQRVSECVY